MSLKGKLDDLDVGIIQFQNLEPKTQEYIDDHIVELCKTYIITEIAYLARAANIPQGFIDGLDVIPAGRGEAIIINKWGTPEKPLAKWFNYGTRDHGPKTALRLHWIDKKTGKHIYAKWVRGVPKTLVMELGIEIGMKYLIDFVLRESRMEVARKVGIVL